MYKRDIGKRDTDLDLNSTQHKYLSVKFIPKRIHPSGKCNRTFSSSPIAFLHSADVPFGSSRGGNEKKKEGEEKTARLCRQLEKRRNSWSVSDIIVVVGVSGMRRRCEAGKKEDTSRRTRSSRSRSRRRRSHMHRATATTIQFGALHRRHVTISRLRASWATPCSATAYAYKERTQPPTRRVGRPRVCCSHEKGGGRTAKVVVWRVERWLEKKDDGGVARSGRRVLGGIFCIWICRICQISQTMPLPHRPFFSRLATNSTQSCLFPTPLFSPPTSYVSHAPVLVGNAHASGTFEEI